MTVQQLSPPSVSIVPKSAALANHWLGGAIHTLEVGPTSRFAFSCTLATFPGGNGPVWHYHTREEEFFFIRSGTFEFEGAGAPPVHLSAGDFITLPIGIPHRFSNTSDGDGEVLLWTSPGGNAQFFLELSDPLDQPNTQTDPPDVARFIEVGKTYGIVMLGPDVDAVDHIQRLAGERRPIAVRHDERNTFAYGSAQVEVLAEADETDGQCEVAQITLPPGATLPPDSARMQHGRYGVGYVVLDGRVEVNGAVADRDSLIVVPFGAPYGLSNTGDSPAVLQMLASPSGLLAFLRGEHAAGVLLGAAG